MKKSIDEISVFASNAIKVISYVSGKGNLPSFDADFDWKGFLKFCVFHKILNIISFGLRDAENIPDIVKEVLSDNILKAMSDEAQRDVEIELLSEDFERHKIRHMIMKGYVIRNLYPQPFLRSMGDIDILVGDGIKDAAEVIKEHGFSLDGEAFLHDIYIKNKKTVVELHKSLIDESLYDLYGYFGIGFEKAKPCDGYKYKYELSKEDFYIFLTAHMAKHYKINGTGIRSVLDIYIYNSYYENVLDRDYISSELEKIGLKTFEEKIRKMSFDWFDGSFNGKFDAAGEYIISSGVFGSSDNHELNAYLLDKNKSGGKFRYLLNCIFPDKEYMSTRYAVLKKLPFLLPLYWIIRIFSTFFNSKKSIRYRLKGVAEASSDADKKFRDTGLK